MLKIKQLSIPYEKLEKKGNTIIVNCMSQL